MPQRTVLYDRVAYYVKMGTVRQRLTAHKGDVIDLDPTEIARLEALVPPAVGDETALLAARIRATGAPITVPTGTASLRLMSVEALARYMASASEKDADQVSSWMDELLGEFQADAELRVAEERKTREVEASRLAGSPAAPTPAATTPAPPVPKPAAELTLDEARAALQARAEASGADPEAVAAILSEFDALMGGPETTGAGEDEGSAAPGATDEELKAMNADDLIVYLSQHPGDLERIEALEAAWGKGKDGGPRSTVQSVIDKTRETRAGL